MSGIFICYRRKDTDGQARALYERLSARFPSSSVFFDVDSVGIGVDFRQRVRNAMASSKVCLVLIGRDWQKRTKTGRRLDNPDDNVRLEVLTALELGILIIPVLIERAPMPRVHELPAELEQFSYRNALELENARWESDVQRLITQLDSVLPPSAETRAPKQSRSLRIAGAAALGTIAAVVVALVVMSNIGRGGGRVESPPATAIVTEIRALPTSTTLITTPPTFTTSGGGVFRTSVFGVPFNLGPAPGWRARAEQSGKVELVLDTDPVVGILTFLLPTSAFDPQRSYRNGDSSTVGAEQPLPTNLDGWLHAHPRLRSSPSMVVSRSGVQGTQMTAAVTGGEPYSGVSDCDPGCALLLGYGTDRHFFLAQGNGNRVEIFRVRSQLLVISLETANTNYARFAAEVDQLLTTLQFR
jgi:hypothetical protein